jgi:hypothetical protein
MTYKKAYYIFSHINDIRFTTSEKLEALYTVSHTEPAKRISPAYTMTALRWLTEIEPEWRTKFRMIGMIGGGVKSAPRNRKEATENDT